MDDSKRMFLRVATVLSLFLQPTPGQAQDAVPAAVARKPKYSLPWGLRPGIAPSVIRSDSSFALSDPQGNAFASTLTGGYKLMPNLGLYAKAALTYSTPAQPAATMMMPTPPKVESAAVLSNPLIFGLYTPEIAKGLWLPVFFGVTLPVGGGGGDDQDVPKYKAQTAGLWARSAMDNALFAVNYFTMAGGVGATWVHDRLTVQGEVTLLQLLRVRGDKTLPTGKRLEPDGSRTNSTVGFHVGYAVIDMLTLSAELRYQRWLSEPTVVELFPTRRDQMTAGVGARVNLPLGKITLRPGIAYFHPLDDPMAEWKYRVITVDVPVLF